MKPYFLYVGNAYPHKNLERLVLVFKGIKQIRKDFSLVLVGGSDYFFERLKNFVLKESIEGVVFPGFVPDEELDLLYREAQAYVFPSLYEGFGLPPLEALAKNTPVISSCRTSMPEILGSLAEYFDPENEKDMFVKIHEATAKKNVVDSELLIERMKIFDWKKMALETRDIYRDLI